MATISTIAKASPRQIAACEALLYGLMQRCGATRGTKGVAIAFVSAHPGAGVSRIAEMLEEMLNDNHAGSAISMDCTRLGFRDGASWKPANPVRHDGKTETSEVASRNMLGKLRERAQHLDALTETYRFVLLDCHSLDKNTDVLGLAQLLDGVIVIVEGSKTTKSQLDYLERAIEMAGGEILGTVLNKRVYPIPTWISSVMEGIGV